MTTENNDAFPEAADEKKAMEIVISCAFIFFLYPCSG
jgi:hypothetical protein